MVQPPTRFSVRALMLAVVLVGLLFGLRRHAALQHYHAVADLRQLGAQLDISERRSAVAWFVGATAQVHDVQFLGPEIGDEDIDSIVQKALKLRGLRRMSFTETSLSRQGEAQLRSCLDGVEITVWRPVLTPPTLPTPQIR
jgi:hypothetical protein